jgi:hypothetical protein
MAATVAGGGMADRWDDGLPAAGTSRGTRASQRAAGTGVDFMRTHVQGKQAPA